MVGFRCSVTKTTRTDSVTACVHQEQPGKSSRVAHNEEGGGDLLEVCFRSFLLGPSSHDRIGRGDVEVARC